MAGLRWAPLREIFLCFLGAGGFVNEIRQTTRDPMVLTFCMSLMGVAAVFGRKEKS